MKPLSTAALAGRFFLLLLLSGAGLFGCAADTGAWATVPAPMPGRRSNVVPPSITVTPAQATVQAGDTVVFIATPAGGEAILFSVDWQLQEGAAAGSLNAETQRSADRAYRATYTAPRTGAGPFHVVAALREFPSARAVASVTVTPQP